MYQDNSVERIEEVYATVFDSSGKAAYELPSREGKSFALTSTFFETHKDKLVKTIAAIANCGEQVGYIIFRGRPSEDPTIDAAKVDDAIRSAVYPRVQVEVLPRQTIDGRCVDFIRIGKSVNRPHLLRGAGGELTFPLRGAANNITAARHELDAMYEERTIETMRRAFGLNLAPSNDVVEEFLLSTEWGRAFVTEESEFGFAIVPEKVDGSLPAMEEFLQNKPHALINNAINDVINSGENTDWLAIYGGIVTRDHEDAVEIYQPAKNNQRIATIMLYDSGAIVSRVWILEPDFTGTPIFSLEHFTSSLRATLKFAGLIYARVATPASNVEIRAALFNAQHLDLLTHSGGTVHKNRDVGRELEIPKRPEKCLPEKISTVAPDLAKRYASALRKHYD